MKGIWKYSLTKLNSHGWHAYPTSCGGQISSCGLAEEEQEGTNNNHIKKKEKEKRKEKLYQRNINGSYFSKNKQLDIPPQKIRCVESG